ncbi:MAG: Uma2 family endonuclease, partial [Gammaproteobacteria bacterium]|nr:Uma2 family endonuclease [Gammaproteobacteria bacterium]
RAEREHLRATHAKKWVASLEVQLRALGIEPD